MNKNMSKNTKIDARANFIDILSSTEKSNKNDYMLNFLVNKTKEDYKKQVLYANSKHLYLDSDIYSPNLRKSKKKTKTVKFSVEKKPFKRNSKFKITNLTKKKSYSIGNINMFNNNLSNKLILKLNSNKTNINIKNFLDEDEDVDELDKFSSVNNTERKRFDKLDNLNSILELVDIHEKTTQNQIVDEKEIKRLNMVRNKKKLELYHTCITYNKNNLFFNKKYKLIYDKTKNINNIYSHTQNNKTINNSNSKNKKRNNINTLLTEEKFNTNINIPLKPSRIQSPISFLSSKTNSNFEIQLSKAYKNRNQNLNLENSQTREVTPYSNPYATFSEGNIFKTHINSNNLKKRIFKADIILNRRNFQNKQISKVYSDILSNYKKIKNQLSNNYISNKKEQKEKEKNIRNIKNLIKKRRTNLRLLVKELDLNYNREKEGFNLEDIVINKRNIIKDRMKNTGQRWLLNQVQQQVINEDNILSKKLILETNLEKKLKSRKKKLSEKMFEEMTLKRKELKNHLIGFKLIYEKDYINKLMKNELPNFNVPQSLTALLHKYKIMKF
jgi:hypothetical protein